MTSDLLITQDDIKVYAPAAELDDARINPYIKEAMELDLKPILNDAFYFDFVNKVGSTGDPMYAAYQELLNGKDYVYQDLTINYPGIKPMLSYYALARFVRDNPVHVTRFGVVTKTLQQSEPVDPKVLYGYINEKKSSGLSYQNQVIKFLWNNASTYPLYNTGGGSINAPTKTSFKMFKL